MFKQITLWGEAPCFCWGVGKTLPMKHENFQLKYLQSFMGVFRWNIFQLNVFRLLKWIFQIFKPKLQVLGLETSKLLNWVMFFLEPQGYEKTQPPTPFRKKKYITSCPPTSNWKISKKTPSWQRCYVKDVEFGAWSTSKCGRSLLCWWLGRAMGYLWYLGGGAVSDGFSAGCCVCVFYSKILRGGFTVILPSLCIYNIG